MPFALQLIAHAGTRPRWAAKCMTANTKPIWGSLRSNDHFAHDGVPEGVDAALQLAGQSSV